VAERLGVGPERLQGINPRLVYCGISGFGNDGPWKDRPAFDTVSRRSPGSCGCWSTRPIRAWSAPAIGDAVSGFLRRPGRARGALRARRRPQGPAGRDLDVRGDELLNLDDFTQYLSVGEVMGPWSRPHVSQSYVFQCADGGWIALHMSSPPKFWENLAEAGRPARHAASGPSSKAGPARIANYEKSSNSSPRSSRSSRAPTGRAARRARGAAFAGLHLARK
jgi:crotonobetainyl-CoA:carnitine CoA-transferase CaiB-like acyl-CoA transferase